MSKAKAILEVAIVLCLTCTAVWLISISPLAAWQTRYLERHFLEYGAISAIPALAIYITRRNRASYGLTLSPLRYHTHVARTCFIPYSLAFILISFIPSDLRALRSLLSAALAICVLFLCARLLKGMPIGGGAVMAGTCGLVLLGIYPARAISAFIFYALFLGPGEELLFRGYMQSRLNESFSRPYRFFDVAWGWGAIHTALFFGLFHVINLPALTAGRMELMWWSGLSSFCWGLFFSFVREKTGSITAPAILHGVPQAIAWAYLRL
jgi:membrane protease YdiL (CAAX protease family)